MSDGQDEGVRIVQAARSLAFPPLSPRQVEQIAALLSPPTPAHELMVWRLRLYCGHVVDRRAHRSHLTVHGAFCGSVACPECGLDPATIVDAVAADLAAWDEEPVDPFNRRHA